MMQEFLMLLQVLYILTKSILLCFVIEAFLSGLQNKKISFKRGFCIWGLYFFGATLIGNLVAHIGNSYDARQVTARNQISFVIKEFKKNHSSQKEPMNSS